MSVLRHLLGQSSVTVTNGVNCGREFLVYGERKRRGECVVFWEDEKKNRGEKWREREGDSDFNIEINITSS